MAWALLDPSSFSLFSAWSLSIFLIPSQSLCPPLSSEIKHKTLNRRWLLPSLSLICSQTWLSSTTNGWRFTFGDSLFTPFNGHGWSGLVHLRANPGFGVFWFNPLLLTVAYLQSTSFIGRIFSGLSEVGVALFRTEWSALVDH